jgi:hypothetical protein
LEKGTPKEPSKRESGLTIVTEDLSDAKETVVEKKKP